MDQGKSSMHSVLMPCKNMLKPIISIVLAFETELLLFTYMSVLSFSSFYIHLVRMKLGANCTYFCLDGQIHITSCSSMYISSLSMPPLVFSSNSTSLSPLLRSSNTYLYMYDSMLLYMAFSYSVSNPNICMLAFR